MYIKRKKNAYNLILLSSSIDELEAVVLNHAVFQIGCGPSISYLLFHVLEFCVAEDIRGRKKLLYLGRREKMER